MLNFTDENFDKEISEAEKLVLVDFWMDGCGPCVLLSPIMKKLAGEFSDRVIFAKANFDQIPATLQKYGIAAAPTVILFEGGEPVSGFVGLRQESEIRAWIEDNLKKDND